MKQPKTKLVKVIQVKVDGYPWDVSEYDREWCTDAREDLTKSAFKVLQTSLQLRGYDGPAWEHRLKL